MVLRAQHSESLGNLNLECSCTTFSWKKDVCKNIFSPRRYRGWKIKIQNQKPLNLQVKLPYILHYSPLVGRSLGLVGTQCLRDRILWYEMRSQNQIRLPNSQCNSTCNCYRTQYQYGRTLQLLSTCTMLWAKYVQYLTTLTTANSTMVTKWLNQIVWIHLQI